MLCVVCDDFMGGAKEISLKEKSYLNRCGKMVFQMTGRVIGGSDPFIFRE